jgi:hypothetical protein
MGRKFSLNIDKLDERNIIPLFVDVHMDDILSATYGRKFSPQLFFISNETKKAYSWEYDSDGEDILDWVLNGTYLKSNTSFAVPRVLPWQLYVWYNYREAYCMKYHYYIGNAVNYFIHMYMPQYMKALPPISWIHDFEFNDKFQKKDMNAFYGFLILCFILANSMLQVFRRLCCRKKIVIKKKKNVDKDD